MRFHLFLYCVLTGWLVCLAVAPACAQTPVVINTTNGPDSSWMGKDIPSVTLGKKKFNLRRKLYQNLITRFNAYYNAHTKLERVVEKATQRHENNYDSLLTLFPYSPGDFEGMRTNLDSVIYDASYGIEVHDPRSKWMDNLYLIAGQAYLYKGDYFNAIAAFKFIIKEKGATDKEGAPEVIGTRGYTPQEQISVATPELNKKLFYHLPSRNDAFIWLIRSYIDSGSYDLARNLISTLNTDPVFPSRLHTPLLTLQAWFYFRQSLVAKGIPFLEKAVDSVRDKRTQARWQFLLGQYYQQDGQWSLAQRHFQQVTGLPADPMMHFYAYLNMTEMQILEKKEDFKTGSEPLLAMARKDKYERYRSIIFYNLGRMALKSSLRDEAITYFRTSLRYNRDNVSQTLLTTHLLADTYYAAGRYRDAKRYYDSTALSMNPSAPDYAIVSLRKDALGGVVTQLDVIARQDSLQQLAAMPHDQLMAVLEQIVSDSARARRKRNLILREPPAGQAGIAGLTPAGQTTTTPGSSPKDWYFYNNSLKAKGFSLFRSEWGKRTLQDNWRTQSGSAAKSAAAPATAGDTAASHARRQAATGGITVEDLLAGIPLTAGQKQASDDSVREALFTEATIFYDRLSDDSTSLRLLQELENRFPGNAHEDEVAYRMTLIYGHLNDPGRAAFYRQQLAARFRTSKFTQALYGQPRDTAAPMKRLISGIYDSAYLAYLGGSYERALQLRDSATRIDPANAQKARFDLLGAMVLLKQQSDSAGKVALRDITQKDAADTAIAGQARAILDTLNHKQELVEHLAHLQLPEPEAPPVATAAPPAPPQQAAPHVPRDTVATAARAATPARVAPPVVAPRADTARDTIRAVPAVPPPPQTPYKLSPQEPHFVVLAFNRTDKQLIDESLNRFAAYNQKNHLAQGIEVSSYLLGHNQVVLIFRLFPDEVTALKYYQEISQKAPTSIIPEVPRDYYRLFIISRDNFILLNNTKDYQGYLQFFSKNYRQL